VILSIAALGYLLSGPAGSVLLCTGKAQRMFVITAAGTVVMVLAVAAAAPLGAIGVACAVLAGTWFTRFLLVLEVRRILHTEFVNAQLLMIGACAAAGVVVCRLMSAVGAIPAALLGCALALLGGALVLRRAGDLTFLTRM
jgi:O-antigen/teichoic acid export membrane protein